MQLTDMGANARVMVLSEIAIEAKDLQVGRESFSLDSRVEVPPYVMSASSIIRAIIIDMIQCQKGSTGFITAHTLTPIMGQNFFFESLGLPTPVVHSASSSLSARAVTTIFGTEAAPNIRPSDGGSVTKSPPALVMFVASPSCEEGVIAFVDCTNLIHFWSHFIIANIHQEIKSWAM